MDKSDDPTPCWSVSVFLYKDPHGNNEIRILAIMANGDVCRLATYKGKPYIDEGQFFDIEAVIGSALSQRLAIQGSLLGHNR